MFALFFMLTLATSVVAGPILSINQSNAIQCNDQSNNQTTTQCNQCNATAVPLTFPTINQPVSCQVLSNSSNLWYSTSVNQSYTGYDVYYIPSGQSFNQSASACNSTSRVTSFAASPTQCSNTSVISQSFYLINQSTISNQSLINNQTGDQSTCGQNCTYSLTCPVNATQSISQSTYQLSMSIPCPAGCDPSFAARFDQSINQCLMESNNQSLKLCACYSTSYLTKVASGCYVDAESISQLNDLAANRTQYCGTPAPIQSSSSSTGSFVPSSTGPVSSPRGIDEGALIGGVLGGIGGIIVMILVLRWCMRYQKGTNIERFRNQPANRATNPSSEMANRQPINQEDEDEVLSDEDSDFESSDDDDDLPPARKQQSRV